MTRLYLSPPDLVGDELDLVRDAFASNWIAPLGPHVDAFEREVAETVGVGHAAALVSGTSALHLALRHVGVGPGDHVLVSTMTFVASASPIVQLGAEPIFVDADDSWNLDPHLVEEEIRDLDVAGRLPKAVVAVDLYGQPADYGALEEICGRWGVPLIEDAAEALGARRHGRAAGAFGRCGVFSFNGNKILTTSGGGMLVSDDAELIRQARFLATQARDPAPHYEHSTLGYNYRLSNVLAAIGRGQLRGLEEKVDRRRRIFDLYHERLGDLPGVSFMPEAPDSRANRWLTCLTIDPEEFGVDREAVRRALEADDVEARPIWKPMHLQPVFRGARVRGGAVSEAIFRDGLCLPSGSAMTEDDVDRVVRGIRALV